MTVTASSAPSQVLSADGTPIAVFVRGTGRPLILVHGTTSDHTAWQWVSPYLEENAQVHAVDRRGRGASGDGPAYSLQRECDDLVAVLDAAADLAGGPVDVLGHSFGGNIAFGAAARTDRVRRLVLYEGWPPPDIAHRTTDPRLLARLETLLADGHREEMLEAFLRDLVQMADDEVATVRAAPTWPARVAAAHTVPRELRAFASQAFDPSQAARLTVPVLLLVGSESPPEIQADPQVVAAALPDARIRVLDGHAHIAHLTGPGVLAEAVLEFLAG